MDLSTAEPKIRLVLLEAQAILRDGLRALLALEADIEVVGSTGDGATAVSKVRALQPHLVVADLELPDGSGQSVIRELLSCGVRLLVLTASDEGDSIRAALNMGVHGYILKDSGRADLLRAIRAVVAGRQYLCPAVLGKVVTGFVSGVEGKPITRSDELVTDRERQVLTRIALGQSNKMIARDLVLSVKTVEKHRANLMRKLTLHNAAAVTLFALRHGFIDADPAHAASNPHVTSLPSA
jgi:two-component system response regulator NreC